MRIIQSFSSLKEWGINYKYLYSMLLSYITLKKYYGDVTMICDLNTYNIGIKHIPFDNFKFIDNPYINNTRYWSFFKLEAMKSMEEPFIYVDSDVFFFEDLLSPFIENDKYQIVTQNYTTNINDFNGYYDKFIENDLPTLLDEGVISNDFKMGSVSTGVIGMKNYSNFHDYIKYSNILVKLDKEKKILNNYSACDGFYSSVCEEFALYLYLQNKPINYALIEKNIIPTTFDNKYNYTHLLGASKYLPENIEKIRTIIINDHPEYIEYLNKIDNLLK